MRRGRWERELIIPLPFDDARVRQAVADVFAGAPYRRKISIWERIDLPSFPADPRVIWGTVAVAIVVLAAFWVTRTLSGARDRGGSWRDGRPGVRRDEWLSAEELAAAGRFPEALHFLYAAVVERLGRDGRLDPHPAKTSREYARELGARSGALRTAFTSFALDYERAVFGALTAGPEDYAHLAGRARALVKPS